MKALRNALILLSVVIFISITAFAGPKERDWKVGVLRDSSRSRYFAGTVGDSNESGSVNGNGSYSGNSNTSATAIYRVYQNFEIEGDLYVYLAQEHIKWRWSKPADLTVNGKVKYAVEKRKLYVVDDQGKEHEMEIIKKVLKQSDRKAN